MFWFELTLDICCIFFIIFFCDTLTFG